MSLMSPLLASSLIAFGLWLLYTEFGRNSRRRKLPLPPGPRGRWLLGNWELLKSGRPEELFRKWGEEFESDIVHTRILGQDVICLNSAQAANDLIDKRSLNYGDRPKFRLFEVMGWAPTLTFLSSSSPQFKLHRSLFQTCFSNTSIRSYQPIQMDEAKRAVKRVIERPDEWEDVTLEMATSIIWRVAFGKGYDVCRAAKEGVKKTRKEAGGRFFDLAKQAAEVTTKGGFPGLNLVDLIPGIQCLPEGLARLLVPELSHARQSREVIENMTTEPWEAATADLEKGERNGSFVGKFYPRMQAEKGEDNTMTKEECRRKVLEVAMAQRRMKGGQAAEDGVRDRRVGVEGKKPSGTGPQQFQEAKASRAKLTETELKGAAAAVLVAGGSTTWSTVLACLLFLTLFPDAQAKIHRELDECLAQSKSKLSSPSSDDIADAESHSDRPQHLPPPRLPVFEDLTNLPYLGGFVHEVLRLLPLNPLIIPHANTDEDEYDGHLIPARSTILVNAKAINMDPATYQTPEAFEPERYFPASMGGREEPPPTGNFGFGRRKCPGRELALQGVRICLAVMLGVLQVRGRKKAKTYGGEVGVSVGLGGHPEPFEADLTVRRHDLAELLMSDIEKEDGINGHATAPVIQAR